MPAAYRGATGGLGCGLSVRNFVECRAVDFHRNEGVESRDEKNPGHTRDWRDDRCRCGCKSDAGGRPMAASPSPSPSWPSRRPNCRWPGGRGPHWRCARSTKVLLQLCVRTRLFRADLSRPARKLLGRLALARAPRRGLLLTRRFSRHPGKRTPGVTDAKSLCVAGCPGRSQPSWLRAHRSIAAL
jgi:hypothetical protein